MTKRLVLIGCFVVLAVAIAGWLIRPGRQHNTSRPSTAIDYDPPWVKQHQPVGWVFGRMIGVQPSAYPTIGPSVPHSVETVPGPRPDSPRP